MTVGAAPVSSRAHRTSRAHRDLRTVLLVRACLAVAGAAAVTIGAVALAQAGITSYPLSVSDPGAPPVQVASYSGPLLATAIGLGTVAGLLLVSAVTDLWRRALIGPFFHEPGTLDA